MLEQETPHIFRMNRSETMTEVLEFNGLTGNQENRLKRKGLAISALNKNFLSELKFNLMTPCVSCL